jgi:formate dehydrogenase accessory protein FdhD
MSSTPEAASVEVAVKRWQAGRSEHAQDRVAEEVPVALVYHGVPHVVMLATPSDLEDYAVGFTLSEGLVASASEIQSVEVVSLGVTGTSGKADPANAAGSASMAGAAVAGAPGAHAASGAAASAAHAFEVRIAIAAERFSDLLQRRRNLTGRTGCGLCGTETLDQAMRPVSKVAGDLQVCVRDLHDALGRLESMQPVNSTTGSVHAAAWALPGKGIQFVREDVGRHNALDKAIGALVRSGSDVKAGYMLITSRASYEMVQKSATAGIALLAAVSAPTALAIRIAEQTQLTLIGFARRDRHVVYTHPQRLIP